MEEVHFSCDVCKLYFNIKPTAITVCPLCKNRLNIVLNNSQNYQVYGSLKINNSKCMCCGEKIRNSDTVYVLEKYHQNSETEKSKLVLSKCWNNNFDDFERDFYKLDNRFSVRAFSKIKQELRGEE